jgi:hypothetical protein
MGCMAFDSKTQIRLRLPVDGYHVKVTIRINGGELRTNGGE